MANGLIYRAKFYPAGTPYEEIGYASYTREDTAVRVALSLTNGHPSANLYDKGHKFDFNTWLVVVDQPLMLVNEGEYSL